MENRHPGIQIDTRIPLLRDINTVRGNGGEDNGADLIGDVYIAPLRADESPAEISHTLYSI